jgi:hypothetical protein
MISTGLPELVGDWSTGLSRKVAGLAPAQVDRLGLQSLVRAALALAQLHRQLWEGTRAALAEGGCEARELADHCRFLLRMAEANAKGYETLRSLAEARGLAGTDDVPELQELTTEIEAAQPRQALIAQLLASATQAPAPVDPARLAEAEAAFAEGRYKKGRDAIARLRSPKASP